MLKSALEAPKKAFEQFPPQVRIFLLRGLVLFALWKFVYLFFWAQPRTLDGPLTNTVGNQSVWILNQVYQTNGFKATPVVAVTRMEGEYQIAKVSKIEKDRKHLLNIADDCNGLELFILYIGFILSMPASIKRKLIYLIGGVFIIHLVNLLRCVGLSALLMHWDRYFDLAHHYIFKIMVYSTIFVLWVRFSNNLSVFKTNHESVQ
jgi:exosortase family protein XrtF